MSNLHDVSNMLDSVSVELNTVKDSMDYLYEQLFGGTSPSDNYKLWYKQLQSLFHVVIDTLHRDAGKISLIVGDDEASFIRAEQNEMAAIRSLGKWWKQESEQHE